MSSQTIPRRDFLQALLGVAGAGAMARTARGQSGGPTMFQKHNGPIFEQYARSFLGDVPQDNKNTAGKRIKWGYHLEIIEGKEALPEIKTVRITLKNEEADYCRSRNLATLLRWQGDACVVDGGLWRRIDEESDLVYSLLDVDFMRIILTKRPGEINNLLPSTAFFSGTPQTQLTLSPQDVGIDLSEYVALPIPANIVATEQRVMLQHGLGEADPWSILTAHIIGMSAQGHGIWRRTLYAVDGTDGRTVRRVLTTDLDFNDGINARQMRVDALTDFGGTYAKDSFSKTINEKGYYDRHFGVDNVLSHPPGIGHLLTRPGLYPLGQHARQRHRASPEPRS